MTPQICAIKCNTLLHARREIAYLEGCLKTCYLQPKDWSNVSTSGLTSSKLGLENCQHRYPSPSRSASKRNRPTPPLQSSTAVFRSNSGGQVASAAYVHTLRSRKTSNQGVRACRKSHLLAQHSSWLSAYPAVSKQMATVRSPERLADVSRERSFVKDPVSKAPLSARSAECFSTTSPAANQTNNSLESAAQSSPLCGVLRS